jgi:hypothetical protein
MHPMDTPNTVEALQADYRAAQANGHHVDCDGYRAAHKISAEPSTNGGYTAVCSDCAIQGSWYRTRQEAERARAGHTIEVPCTLQCHDWS